MPGPPNTPDVSEWHRYFAMQANNRAWKLSVMASRTPGEDREMLDAAHASAWHWAQVGTELNRMRATMLLAEVHALAGDATLALGYAREMRAYFLGKGETPDWELAIMHAVTAHCAAKGGEGELHRSAYASARDAIAAIADEEDRQIVAQTFAHVPAP
jgi:hypothetical protein